MLRLTLPTLLLAAATPGLAQDAEPTLPAFDPAAFADPAANPLWTLEQGQVRTYEAITPEGVHELEVVTVMGDGPVISTSRQRPCWTRGIRGRPHRRADLRLLRRRSGRQRLVLRRGRDQLPLQRRRRPLEHRQR